MSGQLGDYVQEAIQAYDTSHGPFQTTRSLGEWNAQVRLLTELAEQRAASLNRQVDIAACCESMQGFWDLVRLTDDGNTDLTYWDTYENGRRRRLERHLARAYGSNDAVLVNCGMSALSVALNSCGLRPGSRLLVGRTRYFETSSLLTNDFQEDIDICEVPVDEPGAVVRAIDRFEPHAVLLETVANSPSVEVPRDICSWANTRTKPTFIIDNSAQSLLTKWFDMLSFHDRLIVVESGTKYITNSVMCGIVYTSGQLASRARDHARDNGQYLQARALSYLHEETLALLELRTRIHSRNSQAFTARVQENLQDRVNVCGLNHNMAPDNESIFKSGSGCLVFIRLHGSVRSYDRILTDWRDRAVRHGGSFIPDIRAGFGWIRSSARVYETTKLNRADAPTYLRVSVGVENLDHVVESADRLCEAIKFSV